MNQSTTTNGTGTGTSDLPYGGWFIIFSWIFG
jgi:hypothetical protein